MYKLFLCFRYLRSRVIAYFAMLAVALCVAMMLIVISVMNGFLDKIENAAKGLYGDIVVASNLRGIGRYDEFIEELTEQVPQVEAASPFIFAYGLLSIPGQDYRQILQVAGIRLPERAKVTDFEDGLFTQRGLSEPTFDPPVSLLRQRLEEHNRQLQDIYRRESSLSEKDGPLAPEKQYFLTRLDRAWLLQIEAEGFLLSAQPHQQKLAHLQRELATAEADAKGQYSQQAVVLAEQLDELIEQAKYQPPDKRAILGLGIPGLIIRTEKGETVRYIVPGHQVVLSIMPLGRSLSSTDIPTSVTRLTVVDDCRTDVSSIDSGICYVPFETLQSLNNMDAEYSADDPDRQITPPRCSQIHIKVRDADSHGERLLEVNRMVQSLWQDFLQRYPDAVAPGVDVTIETWRQMQAKVIGPIQQQRTLVVIMFGIISLVSVVLIFVIFYTIVVQKTRDVGVLKAIGASSAGVAQIFLAWGAAVGLVGSILGCIGGYYFVKYINPIQDTMDRWFGFRVWSREWFLFEKIPNTVDPTTAVNIMIAAVLAGLAGAAIPAIRAARMQPVEALRYE